jgi:DNA sulfur modification protein DndD
MPARIKSIAFNNFYNYYSNYDINLFEFADGLNVIVADNENGKSKLFNGFLWILEDKVVDSDSKEKRPIDLKSYSIKVVNDRAKLEASVGERIPCGVKLVIEDNENEYIIQKCFELEKLGVATSEGGNYNVHFQSTSVRSRDKLLKDFRPIVDKDGQNRVINKIVDPAFRQYALLQGEEVDKVVDLSTKTGLYNTIEALTNIKDIEKLVTLSASFHGKAEKELFTKKRQATSNKDSLDKAIKDLQDSKTQLEDLKKRLGVMRSGLAQDEKEKERLLGKFSTATESKGLKDELSTKQSRLKQVDKDYNNFLKKLNENFFDEGSAWLLYGTDLATDTFSKQRDQYIRDLHARKIGQQPAQEATFLTFLPEGSPDPRSLADMLEEEKCWVCGRDAEKGTPEWHHIHRILHRPKEESVEVKFKNDLIGFFDSIQMETRQYFSKVSSVNDSIVKERKRKSQFYDDKKSLSEQITSLESELLNLGVTDKTNKDNEVDIISSFEGVTRRIGNTEASIKEIEYKVEQEKSNVERHSKSIEDLGDGETVPDAYINLEKHLRHIAEALENAKDQIFDEMISQLEMKANNHYQKLASYNNTDGGVLKFVRAADNTIRLEVIDRNGHIIHGQSEGRQRVKKLAVIMAIISSNSYNDLFYYPLIADAPLSSFGKGFIQGFFEEVPSVFKQCIVMVKDLLDNDASDGLTDVGRAVLADPRTATFYMCKLEKDKAQSERMTNIQKLK